MMRLLLILLAASCAAAMAAEPDRVPANGGDVLITPILHSSVQLEHAGMVVHVDPWSAGDLSAAKQADLILITDDVGHHLDVKAITQLRKPGVPVVIPVSGKTKVPDGIVLANGERTVAATLAIEAIAAYDLTPGEPYHPKGEANGYVITMGGRRIYIAGVTECVPEIKALRDIDIAFMPLILPAGRMQPAAAAECVRTLKPRVVYPYHYDQAYASRLTNPGATTDDGAAVMAGIEAFRTALSGDPIDVRVGRFYVGGVQR